MISIHALRVEGDNKDIVDANNAQLISIHALRVEGDTGTLVVYNRVKTISIHALRVEGDCREGGDQKMTLEFLSTPSGWRATELHTGT